MGMIERYTAYAEAFEEAYESDNWSVLEQYFTPNAVYDFVAAPPLGDRHEGRATVLKDFKDAVNGFDRRFTSRKVEFVEGPVEKEDGVWVRWAATYTLEGAPDLRMEGEERAFFEGDRIRLLEDRATEQEVQRVETYLAEHGGKLKPAAR
jgi:hypothetical protein